MYGSSKNINVVERLTKDASERIEKSFKKNEDLNNDFSVMYPFCPQLSTFSSKDQNRTMFNDNRDFYERQQEFLHKQHEKLQNRRNQEGKEFSFKPKINPTSEVIVDADSDRANETNEERYMRLYAKDFK